MSPRLRWQKATSRSASSRFRCPRSAPSSSARRAAGATTILNPAPASEFEPRIARSRRYSRSSTRPNSACSRGPSFATATITRASSKRRDRCKPATTKIICVTLGKRGVLALVDGEPLIVAGPVRQGRRHHRRRRLLCRRGRGAARAAAKSIRRRARLRQQGRLDLRAADGRGARRCRRRRRFGCDWPYASAAFRSKLEIRRLFRLDRAVHAENLRRPNTWSPARLTNSMPTSLPAL